MRSTVSVLVSATCGPNIRMQIGILKYNFFISLISLINLSLILVNPAVWSGWALSEYDEAQY
jgi:hypothetical protein